MITVYGHLGTPSDELRRATAHADVVVGGTRHLDELDVPEPKRIALGALTPAVERIRELPEDTDVVVIASGDPLWFGVVRKLRSFGLRPRVVTAASSVAEAFARVGLPWDDAITVSAHGRPVDAAITAARRFAKVAVMTDPREPLSPRSPNPSPISTAPMCSLSGWGRATSACACSTAPPWEISTMSVTRTLCSCWSTIPMQIGTTKPW